MTVELQKKIAGWKTHAENFLELLRNPKQGDFGWHDAVHNTLIKFYLFLHPEEDRAYLMGVDEKSFRRGFSAQILGVVFQNYQMRGRCLCFFVKYSDGTEKYIPTSEVFSSNHYQIVPQNEK